MKWGINMGDMEYGDVTDEHFLVLWRKSFIFNLNLGCWGCFGGSVN